MCFPPCIILENKNHTEIFYITNLRTNWSTQSPKLEAILILERNAASWCNICKETKARKEDKIEHKVLLIARQMPIVLLFYLALQSGHYCPYRFTPLTPHTYKPQAKGTRSTITLQTVWHYKQDTN